MTPDEAYEKLRECLEVFDSIRAEFPCPECDGTGDIYPGGCYTPCEACYGRGFLIPSNEEDE